MTSLFPLLVMAVIFGFIRSSYRKEKNDKKSQTFPKDTSKKREPKAAAPVKTGMDRKLQQEFPHLYQRLTQEQDPAEQNLDHGSLGPVTPQGADPCHDDYHAMPTGSLGTYSMEGMDPCHDEPDRIPLGSLSYASMEGEDPCHEGPRYDVPAEPETGADGLRLTWTGDEMVRGFVYGEIFRRKVG